MRARKTSCKREILHSANKAPLLSRSSLIPSSKTKNDSQGKNLPEREIDFAALTDGTLVEVIEDPGDPNRTLLAVFKNGHVRFTDRLAIGGEILVPVPRTTPGFVDVKLPRGVLPYKSTRNLVLDIGVLIGVVIDMDVVDRIAAACFVLYSWLADRLPTAVYLSVIGLPQSGKSALLELLSLICRRPLLVSDISEAAVRQACSFSPTLLIDEMDWKSSKATSALRQLLRAGTTRSLRALRIGGSSSSFGPKVFSSLEASPDSALNTRCLQLIMRETTKRDLLKPGDPRVLKFASELQEKLLLFRLRHYRSIRPAIVAGAEELRPRSRDLLGALAAPLVRTFFVRGLLESFKGRYDPATRQPLGPQEDMLLAVLFRLIHRRPPLNAVREKELVALTNDNLLRSGDRTIPNEKQGGGHAFETGVP